MTRRERALLRICCIMESLPSLPLRSHASRCNRASTGGARPRVEAVARRIPSVVAWDGRAVLVAPTLPCTGRTLLQDRERIPILREHDPRPCAYAEIGSGLFRRSASAASRI